MDSNMSAAAYMHRIGGSPSTSSASTGSSAGDRGGGGGVGGGGAGGRMAVIGVTRNVRLRRRGPSGFGFSLRGGREYAAGFYVSDVQPGGEAHRNGLRVGDQIIRVNGYPVEDAVHQEVALLAKNQQVLVLKIRSVGMIPVKDNPNDPVTWHIVQQQQQQQQQLQCSETNSGTVPLCTELQIRIPIGEQGRLGCSVCRGIIPGLTVQGTREGGLAQAAGLKAGDVIVWCNGQRLIDLPFERAIEVMRGAAVLNLIVNRPISNHLYDCPESLWMRGSSGYDSESSSLPATSPPSPQRHGDNRMRQGREEAYTRSGRIRCPLALSTSSCSSSSEWSHVGQSPEWSRKVNNTTVIKVNQNPYQRTSYEHVPHYESHGKYEENLNGGNEPLYDPVAPRVDYEIHDFDANLCEEIARRSYQRENGARDITYNSPTEVRAGCCGSKTKFVDDTSNKDNDQKEENRLAKLQFAQRQMESERKTVTTVDVHHSVCPPAPPSMPPLSYKWQADANKPMNAMGLQMGSTMSMGSTGSTETESSLESSCGKDSASTSSSLSTSSCEPASTVSFSSAAGVPNGVANNKMTEFSASRVSSTSRNSASASTDLSSAITQELQRRAQQRSLNNAAKTEASKEKMLESRKQQNPEAMRVQEQKMTHDKLMEEFKRAHRRMFNAAQQRVQFSDKVTEQEQERRTTNGTSTNGPPPPPLPLSSSAKPKQGEDAVEMQSIESFKLKESPSHVVPKPPSTYFPLTSVTTTSASSTTSSVVGKGPLVSGNNHVVTSAIKSQGNDNKDTSPGELTLDTKKTSGVLSAANKQNVKPAGKVAIRIGAYEGETKQPSRLEFLPQAARSSEKGNDEELANGPVVSRLQNELAATLQRSNLKKKTDGDNATIKSASEIIAPISSISEDPNRAMTLMHSDIEKLASALSNNKVTIKVNPEIGSR